MDKFVREISSYLDFIKSKGRPLSEINPGSDEFALDFDSAFQAIQLLRKCQLPIVGGDILSEKSGKLVYAYHYWGSEYVYLDWYCEKMENENESDYVARSYLVAEDSIKSAHKIAMKLGEEFYVVLVV